MKKVILGVLALVCSGFLAAAEGMPAFTGENADSAFFIDTKAFAGAKDLLVLVDQTTNEPKDFVLYVCKKNKPWEQDDDLLECRHLDDTGRFGRYKIPLVGSVGKPIMAYPYIAIVPKDGKKYSYKAFVNHHDLYVFAQLSEAEIAGFRKNAVPVDISAVNANATSDIKFVSESANTAGVGFYVFGKKDGNIEFIGTNYLKENNSSSNVSMCTLNEPKEYSEIAVYASNGKKYNYSAEAKSRDVLIHVKD